eukprot:scaffold9970_cov200-Alexandrium_tamarense.AAC.9
MLLLHPILISFCFRSPFQQSPSASPSKKPVTSAPTASPTFSPVCQEPAAGCGRGTWVERDCLCSCDRDWCLDDRTGSCDIDCAPTSSPSASPSSRPITSAPTRPVETNRPSVSPTSSPICHVPSGGCGVNAREWDQNNCQCICDEHYFTDANGQCTIHNPPTISPSSSPTSEPSALPSSRPISSSPTVCQEPSGGCGSNEEWIRESCECQCLRDYCLDGNNNCIPCNAGDTPNPTSTPSKRPIEDTCTEPSDGCTHGFWDRDTCQCSCETNWCTCPDSGKCVVSCPEPTASPTPAQDEPFGGCAHGEWNPLTRSCDCQANWCLCDEAKTCSVHCPTTPTVSPIENDNDRFDTNAPSKRPTEFPTIDWDAEMCVNGVWNCDTRRCECDSGFCHTNGNPNAKCTEVCSDNDNPPDVGADDPSYALTCSQDLVEFCTSDTTTAIVRECTITPSGGFVGTIDLACGEVSRLGIGCSTSTPSLTFSGTVPQTFNAIMTGTSSVGNGSMGVYGVYSSVVTSAEIRATVSECTCPPPVNGCATGSTWDSSSCECQCNTGLCLQNGVCGICTGNEDPPDIGNEIVGPCYDEWRDSVDYRSGDIVTGEDGKNYMCDYQYFQYCNWAEFVPGTDAYPDYSAMAWTEVSVCSTPDGCPSVFDPNRFTYTNGDQVTIDSVVFECNNSNGACFQDGYEPYSVVGHEVWKVVAECSASTPAVSPQCPRSFSSSETAYVIGDKVSHNGVVYECKTANGWCTSSGYEPYSSLWSQAWNVIGNCSVRRGLRKSVI